MNGIADMKQVARQKVEVTGIGTITALHETQYNDGNRCILATIDFGGRRSEMVKISVNIPDQQFNIMQPGEFFLKNWSEGKPIADALVAAGLIILSGSDVPTGYVRAPIVTVKVNDDDEDSDDEDFN